MESLFSRFFTFITPTTKRIYRLLFVKLLGPYLAAADCDDSTDGGSGKLTERNIKVHIVDGRIELRDLKLNVEKLNELLPRRQCTTLAENKSSPDSNSSADSNSRSRNTKVNDNVKGKENDFPDSSTDSIYSALEHQLKSFLESASESIKEDTSCLQIIDGSLHKAYLDIPSWQNILVEPVTLTIEGLDLKVIPYNMEDIDRELTEESIKNLSNVHNRSHTPPLSSHSKGKNTWRTEKNRKNLNKGKQNGLDKTNDDDNVEMSSWWDPHDDDNDDDGLRLS